jgi:hypothetical protein
VGSKVAIKKPQPLIAALWKIGTRHKCPGYWVSGKERMSHEKSEPGRVAPVIPGRHGPALMVKRDIYYLRLNKLQIPISNPQSLLTINKRRLYRSAEVRGV